MIGTPRMLKVYLGDGLHGEFDGHTVTLRAPVDGGEHWVRLEPEVMQAFLDWIKALMLTYPDRTEGWEP